ncbi:MAG: hypothetical protein ACJAWL_003685 [Motiliproteus sp.]|jgi:uncharacterized protein YjiS (DUF1127 family)
MTTFQATLHQTSGAPFIALFAMMAVWRRNHLTRVQLKYLSPEQLTDIGLSQAQALVEANKPFWQSAMSLAGTDEGRDDER